MATQDLPKPDLARNLTLIGHSDQGGRLDGVQLMVSKGHAFIGHMFSKGFSIVDVRNPRDPKPVAYVAAPPNTWNIHLQTAGDLLLVVNAKDMFASPEFQDERHYYKGALGKKVGTADAAAGAGRDWTAGMTVYDIANPAEPRQIGFMPVEGGGIHRIWYQNAGSRVFDIRDQYRPSETAAFVPPAPRRLVDHRPNRARVIQSCDVFVDRQGLVYSNDYNGGLYIL